MTHREQLTDLFITRPREWIPLPEIMEIAGAQYNARLYEIRRGIGCAKMDIQNKTETALVQGGVNIKNSWYRYIPSEKQLEFAK